MVQFVPDKMWNLRQSVPAALLKDAQRFGLR